MRTRSLAHPASSTPLCVGWIDGRSSPLADCPGAVEVGFQSAPEEEEEEAEEEEEEEQAEGDEGAAAPAATADEEEEDASSGANGQVELDGFWVRQMRRAARMARRSSSAVMCSRSSIAPSVPHVHAWEGCYAPRC